jgi:aryl-alcohol dehydrogenase-like predicted oxidoreductase
MSIFQSPPEPETPLGRMRILSPRCGLRVSPLVLGAMSIGEAWGDFMGTCTAYLTRLQLIPATGSMNKDQSFALLDAYVHSGGNWIDTSGNYQNEVNCDPK